MSRYETEIRAILRRRMSEHIVEEQRERLEYQRGPAIHAARAEAHARAALALHRAAEGDSDS